MIKYKNEKKIKDEEIKIYLYSSNLSTATVSGKCNLTVTNEICSSNFKLNHKGNGDILCKNIICKKIEITNYDSGNITVNCDAEKVTFESMGNGYIRTGIVNSKYVNVISKGNGDIIHEDITCDKIDLKNNGNGNIIVKGKAVNANYECYESGNIIAANLIAKKIFAVTTSSGNINCYAEDFVETKINGTGDIRYRGNPSVYKVRRGSGSIEKL